MSLPKGITQELIHADCEAKYKEAQDIIEKQKEEIHKLTFDRELLLQKINLTIHDLKKFREGILERKL